MPDTVAGLFRTRSEAEEALRKLKEAGFGEDQISVAAHRAVRPAHYGARIAGGVLVGTLVGAIVGAVVAGLVPGMHPLIPGNVLATFALAAVSGAATGGVAGGLLGTAADADPTLYFDQEVQSGRTLVSVAGPKLGEARKILLAAGAIEAGPVEAPLEGGRPRTESG